VDNIKMDFKVEHIEDVNLLHFPKIGVNYDLF
jgi:hypothetical protein